MPEGLNNPTYISKNGDNMSLNVRAVKAVVYDLPSENIKGIPDTLKDRIRSIRVYSTQLLHSLGVQCTESVILIPLNKVEKIDQIITKVKTLYNELKNELRSNGLNLENEPIIEVIDLTESQIDRLLPLAQRRIMQLLDASIDNVSEIISTLSEITETSRLRRVSNNLRRLRSNWNRIYQCARELGIDIHNDYEYLINLIDQALSESARE